jgi:hypothetical protein
MRLLRSKSNDDDFELVTFTDEIPPYAILSHTWTDSEVTYDELVARTGKSKAGYDKIRFCGERAAADNLQYFWVDTCCIDKSSSAELTEAINSMFKWYKQADVCYVKLSDIDLDNVAANSVAYSIASCRWFTRGWCLQELLAPSELLFYDRNDRFIGSKRTLRRPISKITRICEEVLEDASCLYAVPVARRMSWASGRKTTRVEDIAYSLLGIFDVHMPMLYGEGKHAFIRLQEEIIKKSNDLTIFAWRADGEKNAFLDMFASSPMYFHRCNDISDNPFGHRVLSRSLFSVTNRGLQFTSTDIAVIKSLTHKEDPDYILPLNCYITEQNRRTWIYLLLKKIGPGMFVKAKVCEDWDISALELDRPWTIEKEIFVVRKVTPDLCLSIESSHRSSFELRTSKVKLTSFSIQGLEPREAWDTPRSRFLTQGDPSFVGYLKIYPEMASNRGSGFFVVALGFRGSHMAAPNPYVRLVHPDVWARYDAPGRTLAWMVSSAGNQQMEAENSSAQDESELDLVSHKITVALHTRNSRGVPVHRILLDWKQKRDAKRKHIEGDNRSMKQ